MIALFNREIINKIVSLFAIAKNILYNYKMFNLSVDFTTKLMVNFICNGVFNKV